LNSEERVRKGADKLQKFLNSKQQGRLDGFFSVKPKEKEKATAPAKGKGKDKVGTKAKGTKRKVCSKIFPLFPLTFFLLLC
jgi:flap endonuclease-1